MNEDKKKEAKELLTKKYGGVIHSTGEILYYITEKTIEELFVLLEK